MEFKCLDCKKKKLKELKVGQTFFKEYLDEIQFCIKINSYQIEHLFDKRMNVFNCLDLSTGFLLFIDEETEVTLIHSTLTYNL